MKEAMKNMIKDMIEYYRSNVKKTEKSWEAFSAINGFSRSAVYDIINPDTDVKRDTVVLFGLALQMSLFDFITLYEYEGFTFRPFNHRDQLIAGFFEDQVYDFEEVNDFLKKCKEAPISVRVPCMDV